MTYSSSGPAAYGVASNGVVANIVALGAMDIFLIKGASVTFFRFRYARHTNFAIEAVGQLFQSSPAFGSASQIVFNRAGDLIYFMYIVIELPGIIAVKKTSQQSGFPSSYTLNQFPSLEKSVKLDDDDYIALAPRNPNFHSGITDQDELIALGEEVFANEFGGHYDQRYEAEDKLSLHSGITDWANKPEEFVWAHWTNAIAQHLPKRTTLVVGGAMTDVLYSDYLYMWEELTGKAGKRLREMIGKRKSRRQLIKDSRKTQRFYVPLPFWFTQTSGNALPLCTLQFHGVQLHVQWAALQECVVTSGPDVQVLRAETGAPLCANDLQAWVDTTFVYLDIEERNRFALANFDQLVSQTQVATQMGTGTQVNMRLSFNHPVIELIWAIRRQKNELINSWFNYSGINGTDPLVDVSLKLNNLVRFAGREGRYYRLVQPYQHHSSIPKSHVYCYSFALMPEDPQPSGSCNLSRIDNVDMTFQIQDAMANEQYTVIVFARNWNINRYTEGVSGVLFNN